MSAMRAPRSTKAATSLLERFAAIEAAIAGIEAVRNGAIAAANVTADEQLLPLVKERDDILAVVEPWWSASAPALTEGKRKSIELGGCMIGTRQGKESLGMPADEDKLVAALKRRKWAAPLLRVKSTVNKQAVMASIDGVYSRDLKALGLSKVAGKVTFYIERTEQGGTVGAGA